MAKCKSVLIVEDDDAILESLSEFIEQEIKVKPAIAKNGEEALKLIQVMDKPCLILLDMMMPVMDGFTFISKIKEESMEGVAHVVVITASSIKLEGIRVLRKPFDLESLLNVIKDGCL